MLVLFSALICLAVNSSNLSVLCRLLQIALHARLSLAHGLRAIRVVFVSTCVCVDVDVLGSVNMDEEVCNLN